MVKVADLVIDSDMICGLMVNVADLVIDSDMICGQMVNVADLVINRDIIFDHNVDRSYIYAKPWPPPDMDIPNHHIQSQTGPNIYQLILL